MGLLAGSVHPTDRAEGSPPPPCASSMSSAVEKWREDLAIKPCESSSIPVPMDNYTAQVVILGMVLLCVFAIAFWAEIRSWRSYVPRRELGSNQATRPYRCLLWF